MLGTFDLQAAGIGRPVYLFIGAQDSDVRNRLCHGMYVYVGLGSAEAENEQLAGLGRETNIGGRERFHRALVQNSGGSGGWSFAERLPGPGRKNTFSMDCHPIRDFLKNPFFFRIERAVRQQRKIQKHVAVLADNIDKLVRNLRGSLIRKAVEIKPLADARVRLPRRWMNPIDHSTLYFKSRGAFFVVADRFRLSGMVLQRVNALWIGVVIMRNQIQADLIECASVGVDEIGMVLIDQIGNACQPFAFELLRRILRITGLLAGMRRKIKLPVLRIVSVVRNAGFRPGLIGVLVDVEPAPTPGQMLGHSEAQAVVARDLAPASDDVAFWSKHHRIPAVMLGIPAVEVVAVDAERDEVFGSGFFVAAYEGFRFPVLRSPVRDDVFVAHERRMPVMCDVKVVLPRPLDVHIARIPVALPRRALRTPMGPDAEFRIAEPFGAVILLQGLPRASKCAGPQ